MKKELNSSEKRQYEIASKYYDVDLENNIVTVPFHFEKITDVIDEKRSTKEKPIFSFSLLESIQDLKREIPHKAKINIEVSVDDYEGYDKKVLENGIKDALEMSSHSLRFVEGRTWLKSLFILLTGIILLVILNILRRANVIDPEGVGSIFDYVFDTAACVFIWEAISLIFLYPSEQAVTVKSVFASLNSVSFKNSDNELMFEITNQELQSLIYSETKARRKGRFCCLISSSLYISVGLIVLIELLFALKEIFPFKLTITLYIFIFLLVVIVFSLLSGISGILRFLEKGFLGKLAPLFSTISLVGDIALVISLIVSKVKGQPTPPTYFIGVILIAFAAIIFFIGTVKTKKKKNKTNKEDGTKQK